MTEQKTNPEPRGFKSPNPGIPVYDREGKLIGRTGEEPVQEPTPQEKIEAGLKKQAEETMKTIGGLLDASGQAAWEAQHKVRPKSNYLMFSTRLEANARLRELKAQIDENKKAVVKLLGGVAGPDYETFKTDIEEALQEIDRVFKGEA
jgi:hypothetical protein